MIYQYKPHRLLLVDLIILSYHKFVVEPSDYRFSRTYEQFGQDIQKKIYDWITIDDGMRSMIDACEMLKENNVRAKLFIATSLVGEPGYCTWEEIKWLSRWHSIENHSHIHKDHTAANYAKQLESISGAQRLITENIGKPPRYFVAPFNQYNADTEMAALSMGLTCLKDRENILNISK